MTSTADRGQHPEHRGAGATSRLRRRLLHVIALLHRWAESGWSGSAVGTWAVLQGSVAPGPSDALLVPLGLADPKKSYQLASWAIAGSMLGGLIAFAIGAFAFEEIGATLLRLIGIDQQELETSRRLFEQHGWKFVLLSTVAPLSTKAVCIAAGAFGVPLPHFALALFGGRTIRFLTVATLLRFAGAGIVTWVERRIGRSIESLR